MTSRDQRSYCDTERNRDGKILIFSLGCLLPVLQFPVHPAIPGARRNCISRKKNRTFSRKALKSGVRSPGWALVPLNIWHQILLQAMANLSPTSIAKFGLWALSSHHFPSASPLANEISGTEIEGSFKEDVKEKLERCVCVRPQPPRASLFPEGRGQHTHGQICSAALGTAWHRSALIPVRGITAWFSSSTLHCAVLTHLSLCCTCNPRLYNPSSSFSWNFQCTVASSGQGWDVKSPLQHWCGRTPPLEKGEITTSVVLPPCNEKPETGKMKSSLGLVPLKLHREPKHSCRQCSHFMPTATGDIVGSQMLFLGLWT